MSKFTPYFPTRYVLLTLSITLFFSCNFAFASVFKNTGEEIKDVQTSFSKGDIRMVGVCGWDWGKVRKKINGLIDAGVWDDALIEVARAGCESDLSYYYLGRIAEGQKFLSAAIVYYKLSLASKKCNGIFNNCNGHDLPSESNTRLASIQVKPESPIENISNESNKLPSESSTDSHDKLISPKHVDPSQLKIVEISNTHVDTPPTASLQLERHPIPMPVITQNDITVDSSNSSNSIQLLAGETPVNKISEVVLPKTSPSIQLSTDKGDVPVKLVPVDNGNDWTFEQADEALARVEDRPKAFETFRRLAAKGDARSQYMLAECYIGGNGTSKNVKLGMEIMMKLARQDYVDAQEFVGVAYHFGIHGFPIDITQAKKWLKPAAQGGGKLAATSLFLLAVPRPTIGMTTEEVLDTRWGQPTKRTKIETIDGETETWVYASKYGSRTKVLYFDRGGRVEMIQD